MTDSTSRRLPAISSSRADLSPCRTRSSSRRVVALSSTASFEVLTPQISTFPCIYSKNLLWQTLVFPQRRSFYTFLAFCTFVLRRAEAGDGETGARGPGGVFPVERVAALVPGGVGGRDGDRPYALGQPLRRPREIALAVGDEEGAARFPCIRRERDAQPRERAVIGDAVVQREAGLGDVGDRAASG